MQLRQLEWHDIISDDVIVVSYAKVHIYDYVLKIEFQIIHDKDENIYYLYAFGKGSVRRTMPIKFDTVNEAKTAADEIYCNEMYRIKQAVESFWIEET